MAYDEFGYKKGVPGRSEELQKFREVHREASIHEKFRTDLSNALKDESGAGPMYEELAREARELGYPVEAETLKRIATDERTHWALINEILRKLRGL